MLILGETVIGKQFYTRCGGKGANQAVAIAKLCKDKSKMCFVSLIGNDSNGVEISKKLSEVGMRLDEVKVIDDIYYSTIIASIKYSWDHYLIKLFNRCYIIAISNSISE